VAEVLDRAAVALAAEQVGVASRALDMAVEYAKVRHQFGRPIGSFQAVKHLLADVLLEVESTRAAAHYAPLAAENAEHAEHADPELPAVASLAKAFCSEACLQATEENIQVHGGIGFTWEHPAHLYLKRAKTSQLLFGDPAYHRELLARRIGMGTEKGAA
jgi:alkylation response protein AidB-like acyl-CoA dehydrogenase